MAQEKIVLCMKWGDLYSTDYVNLLYRAVCANLTPPFRFVCLTDQADGLDPEIESFELPDLDLPAERYGAGAWPKLGVFQKDLFGLKGRCLFIDLDSVIVGSLDPFFGAKGELIMIGGGRVWKHPNRNLEPEALSGVFAFDLGSLSSVFDAFMADKEDAYERFENEQQVIEYYAPNITFWPSEWVISFKRHLCRPFGLSLFLQPKRPKDENLIVAFHGDPRPVDVVRTKGPIWMNFPRFIRVPVHWVRDYWKRFGYLD